MQLDLDEVDAGELVRNALVVMKERAAGRGVLLSSEIEPDVGPFRADARKLKQVVYNLVSNAVKFTERGGSVRLEVRRVGDGEVLEIVVIDTGIGIAQQEQETVFQPFLQVDSSLTRLHDGTGLGLALVRRLTELHGGAVTLKSELGVGSWFTVRIPYRG